jgi:hypothetical protein
MMEIPEVYMHELISDDQGTISILSVPDFYWSCYINELPERGNKRNISRIPRAARYLCRWVKSPRHGDVYLLEKVPERSAILMHSGNFAGDTTMGYLSDVLGCMEFGHKVAIMKNQRCVINSRSTRDAFQKLMEGNDFYLNIN